MLGLSIAAWAESVAAFGLAAIRGLVYVFQLPFRLCLQVRLLLLLLLLP